MVGPAAGALCWPDAVSANSIYVVVSLLVSAEPALPLGSEAVCVTVGPVVGTLPEPDHSKLPLASAIACASLAIPDHSPLASGMADAPLAFVPTDALAEPIGWLLESEDASLKVNSVVSAAMKSGLCGFSGSPTPTRLTPRASTEPACSAETNV